MASDRDVIAEPVIRLRAERDTLKKDLDAAKADVKNATNEIAREAARGLAEGLEKKLAGVGAALSKAEKAAAKETKQIQAYLDKLDAKRATASVALLEKAVEKAGGTAKLSAGQLAILTQQVDKLAAAGAKIPKTLAIPKAGGVGAGVQAGLGSIASGLAPGGALGSGLAAVGPAGLAAAAGIGAVTVAATKAFDALKSLAAQAEQWTNVATTTGLGVKEVQQLQAYLEDAGFESEDLGKAMKKMATEIEGGGDSLAKFGIDVRELKGLAPEEQFRELARQVTAIADPTERAAAATEAFGKGGAKALAGLQGIASGAYKELGALNEAAVADLLRLDNELDKAGRAWTNWKNEALVALLKVAEQINNQADPANLFKVTATPAELAAGDKLNRAAALADTQAEIAAELARKKKAADLAKEKKDAAEAESRAAKALAEKERRENEYAATFKHNEAEFQRQLKERERLEEEAAKLAERNALAELEAQKKAHEATEQTMQDAEAKVGINERLLAALEAVGPPAAGAQVALDELAQQVALLGGLSNLSAEQLENLRQKIEGLQSKGASRLPENLKGAVDHSKALVSNLNRVADIFADLGANGLAGFVGGLAHSLQLASQIKDQLKQAGGWKGMSTSGKVGIGLGIAGEAVSIGTDAYKGADTNTARSTAKGALGGAARGAAIGTMILPGYGTAIGAIAGGIIGGVSGFFGSKSAQKKLWNGLTQSLVEQFGSLDKAKAAAKGYGIELDKALSSKNAGQLKKAIDDLDNALKKAQQDAANRQQLEQGVGVAAQGAQQLQGVLDQLGPKAQAAGGALVSAVADAMAANGLGVLATGELAKSEKFAAVQQAVGGAGQVFQGLRQAGGISTDLLANGGQFADALKDEAVAAALAAGKTQEEAQKIGIATIAPLLRDQLNASIESGKELSEQQKALLAEAKANGIEIVADPLLAQLEVQKSIDATLRQIAGKGSSLAEAAGGAGGARPSGGQRISAAAGIPGLYTGSSSPRYDLQLHPREVLQVHTGVTSASLAGGMVAAGARGISVTSGDVHVSLGGSNLSRAEIMAAVTEGVRQRDSDFLFQLKRAIG